MFLFWLRYSTGETLLILFGLLMMAGIPFLIGGVVFFVLRRNKKNRAAWLQLAGEIGFEMRNPKHLELRGLYNGIQTRLAVGIRTSGGGETRHREYFTYCTSTFPQPLRFALQIGSPRNVLTDLIKKRGTPLGQDSFDKIFGAKCYDQEVLRRLLLSKFPSKNTINLMGDLMLANQSYNKIIVTDEKVYIETSSHERDHEKLKHLLKVTNGIARRFTEARQKFPLAEWEQELKRNWMDFADRHSLITDSDAFTLSGVFEGYGLHVQVHSEPGKWKTTIELRFPEKLMVGFSIFPEAPLYAAIKLFGFQDIKTGRKSFDDAFIVKAKNVLVAKAKMTNEFCDQMLLLNQKSSAVELNDEKMKVTVERVLGDKEVLGEFIGSMISVMERLR